MVTVFLDETPLPSRSTFLKPYLKRVAGVYFGRAARRDKTPGESLAFLPEADLPASLAWASFRAALRIATWL